MFAVQARELGQTLAERKIGLVYGGGSVGLMGIIADAVLEAGGEVIGVLPEMLATKELLHPGVEQMHIVDSMHTRKAKMTELADGFIAMPGGFGTLEELFEVITWAQLGIHSKPIGLLNVQGFYDRLLQFLEDTIDHGFIKGKNRRLMVVANTPGNLLDVMAEHHLPSSPKWLSVEQS